MAGAAVVVTFDDRELGRLVREVTGRFGSMEPALQIIGATALASVQSNFEKSGRPSAWKALSPVTLKTKPNTKILQVKGASSGLLGSIHYEVEDKRVLIGTDKIYGAIHQFGGKAGRGHKVTIPARPYLLLQDEDWPEIKAELTDYLLEGKT